MSLLQQQKRSRDLQNSTLVHTGLDRRSDPVNRRVMSNFSTYMIVPTVFFKFIALVANTLLIILNVLEGSGCRSVALREEYPKPFKLHANKRLTLNRIIWVK